MLFELRRALGIVAGATSTEDFGPQEGCLSQSPHATSAKGAWPARRTGSLRRTGREMVLVLPTAPEADVL